MSTRTAAFTEVVRDVSGGNAKLPQSAFLKSGALAVVDQGQDFVAGFTDDDAYRFRSETLPVVVFGDHTKAIKYVDFPFAMGADGVKVLKPTDDCDTKYLYHFLRQARIADAGYSRHYKFLKELRVPLPPLPEQRRIAAILDKADALRAKRREAIAKLDQLLQSVFLDMFGDPVTNPKGWPVVSLGDLAAWKSGGTPSRSNPAYFTGDIPWYASGELNGMFISDSAERITKQAVADSAAKLMEPGTLMIGMYDTSAFKLGITTEVGTCNQAIAFGLVNSMRADTLYVYHALDIGKEHFKRLQRGVRQKNLNLSMVRDTRVPCPPVELQKKFSSWFAVYWREVSKQRQAEERLTQLSSSLQTTAFSGGL